MKLNQQKTTEFFGRLWLGEGGGEGCEIGVKTKEPNLNQPVHAWTALGNNHWQSSRNFDEIKVDPFSI